MTARILDLARARTHRLALRALAEQAAIDRLPLALRIEREEALDLVFDDALHAVLATREPDALSHAVEKACIARAAWRTAGDDAADPDEAADAYTNALFVLAGIAQGLGRRRRAR